MNNTKHIGFYKVACLLLALMLLALCAVTATLAMFYSEGSVSGLTVKVSNWSITIGGNDGSGDDVTEGKGEANLGDITWTTYSLGTAEESEVNTIVPGTWGYAEIVVMNNSQVSADIKIEGFSTFLPTGYGNDALTFKVYYEQNNNDAPSTFGSKTTDLCTSANPSCSFTLEPDGTQSIFVCYKWEYKDEDETDTMGKVTSDKDDPNNKYNTADMNMVDIGGLEFGKLSVTAQQAKSTESS